MGQLGRCHRWTRKGERPCHITPRSHSVTLSVPFVEPPGRAPVSRVIAEMRHGDYTQTSSNSAGRVRLTRAQFATEVVVRVLTVPLLGLFVILTVHQYMRDTSRVTLLVFAFAEVLSVGLAVFSRVPRERDWKPLSLAATICATFYFLAFRIEPGIRLVPEVLAANIQLAGLLVQIYAKWSLRRSFGLLPANRGVIVVGPY